MDTKLKNARASKRMKDHAEGEVVEYALLERMNHPAINGRMGMGGLAGANRQIENHGTLCEAALSDPGTRVVQETVRKGDEVYDLPRVTSSPVGVAPGLNPMYGNVGVGNPTDLVRAPSPRRRPLTTKE